MQNSPPPDRIVPIVFAIFMALFLGLLVFLFFAVRRGMEQDKVRFEKAKKLIVSESPIARTVLHDNHWYIDWAYSNMFTHHPDCPCGNLAERNDKSLE